MPVSPSQTPAVGAAFVCMLLFPAAAAAGAAALGERTTSAETRMAAASEAAAALRSGGRPELAPARRVPALRAALGPPPAAATTDGETPRVFGGRDAAPGSWPYQAALLQSGYLNADPETQYYAQFCGGSVVAPDLVLTAAHCIADEDGRIMPAAEVTVLLGATALTEGTRHAVAQVIMHPGYDPVRLDNDIALLRLATPTDVPPVRLADDTPETGPVWVTGWGMTEDESFPVVLQEVKVGLQPQSACNIGIKAIYRADLADMLGFAAMRMGFSRAAIEAAVDVVATGFADPLTANMLCAGVDEGKRDSCYGDSGGPLVSLEPDGPVQHGVVSWGEGPRDGSAACGHAGAYGVYARVARYRDWIDAHVTPAR